MDDIIKYMFEYGYSKNNTDKILNTYPIPNLKPETLLKNMKEIHLLFISIGYSKNDIIKITKECPSIFTFNKERINIKIDDLKLLGYSNNDIIKMTISCPNILSHSIENLNKKINNLISLGYTKEDVIKMTRSFATLFNYKKETLEKKKQDLISTGYTEEEIIIITKKLPNIYGLHINTIKEKIDFYKSINIHKLFIKHPNLLMQSVDLSYARYEFYKSKNISITEENYRKLFMNQKEFTISTGFTNKQLINLYSYKNKKLII